MAGSTTNLGLTKPIGTEKALVSVINGNSDLIDAEAGNVRSNMALVQNTNTATEAIAKDQLVVWKGVLKKATSAIASGATLSASNLANTDIADELAALNNQITTQTVSSSTTIKSLASALGTNTTKRYTATTSATFTDFPGTNTRYYPIVCIYKSGNNAQIDISCVSGNNEPIFIRGYYENNTLYWYDINDQITNLIKTSSVTLTPITNHTEYLDSGISLSNSIISAYPTNRNGYAFVTEKNANISASNWLLRTPSGASLTDSFGMIIKYI